MAHKDILEENRKEYFKKASFKQKMVYFWEYYKIHTFIFFFLFISFAYLINHFLTAKTSAINGTFLNIDKIEGSASTQSLEEAFIERQDIDSSKYEVRFNDGYALTGDTSLDYETDQALWVQMNAGEIDFIVSPHEYVVNYGYQDYFYDLRTILSEDQLDKYESYFLYVDGKVIKEMNEQALLPDAETKIEVPTATSPDEMEEPIPVFINLSSCEKIAQLYKSKYESLAFCIPASAKHLDMALVFLDYVME